MTIASSSDIAARLRELAKNPSPGRGIAWDNTIFATLLCEAADEIETRTRIAEGAKVLMNAIVADASREYEAEKTRATRAEAEAARLRRAIEKWRDQPMRDDSELIAALAGVPDEKEEG